MYIEINKNYILINFEYPARILGSSFFNGGYGRRKSILNIKTSLEELKVKTPDEVIIKYIKELNLDRQSTAAMMTSAHLEYAQVIHSEREGIEVCSIVTAGTSNAINISETSYTPYAGSPINSPGTINIVVLTNMWLTEDCLVSSVISATESKTAALIDLNVKSVNGNKLATGTGTDSIVVISGTKGKIQYAGGHTVYGQLVGEVVYNAVYESLKKIRTKIDTVKMINSSFDL